MFDFINDFTDRCMELREKARGEDMLSVEKKLNRQKCKEENRLRQMTAASKPNVSVFDFINSKLTDQTSQTLNGSSLLNEHIMNGKNI